MKLRHLFENRGADKQTDRRTRICNALFMLLPMMYEMLKLY